MRIGLFSDTYLPELNGVASSVGILKDALEGIGHEVFVVTTRADGIAMSQWENDHVLRLSGIELKSLYGYVLTTPLHYNAFEQIKKLNLDVIHAHTEFGVGIFAHICARMLGLPLVSTYHTTYEDYTHYLNPIGLESVERVAKKAVAKLSKLYGDTSVEVIAPSEKTRDMLLRYHVRSNIHVIPTGLKLDRFMPEKTSAERIAEIRSQYGVKDDEFLITYLGRVAQEKNISTVIEGFKLVKERELPCKLLIVGGGPDEEILQKLAKDLDLEGVVMFAGRQPREDVPAFYHASNAFISASTSETQGMTYIEALASGLPVFAAPDSVLDEIVYEDMTGYYFSSHEEMYEKLNKFVHLSVEERNAFAERCIFKAAPYSMDIFGSRVERVYQQSISNYEHLYVIDKVKTKDEEVQLTLITPSGEDLKVLVSLADYFEHGFRKNGKLLQEQVDELVDHESVVKAYQGCVRKIAMKDRTRKEIYDWLTNETECSIKDINAIVEKLENLGYIDDYKYAQSAVLTMKGALMGNNRIVKTLRKKGVPEDMIESVMANMDDDEYKNALVYAERIRNTIHDKSLAMKKRALTQRVIARGYSSDVAREVVEALSYIDEQNNEINVLKKTALKARRRYEKKLSGTRLRNAIFKYCINNGFGYEDIYAVLDEMEWDDE